VTGAHRKPGAAILVPTLMIASGGPIPQDVTDEEVAGPECVGEPVRVLVVDDEPDLRILLWLAVEADDRCRVVADASDGAEGVDLAAELQPDVVVIDHLMPRMNGIEAVPLLRRAAPDCKIIMLSALGHRHLRAEAIRAGADAYMEKSSSFKPLLDLAVSLARTGGRSSN